MNSNDKISSYQLGVLVYLTVLGVGILTLPASMAKEVENDGWILAIIAGILCIGIVYIMCKVGEKYPQNGFVGTLKILFGKFLGVILALPVFFYFLLFTSLETRIFGETVKLFLLSRTPLEFIIIPILVVSVFLARLGIEPIVRFFEAVTPAILFVLFFLILIAITNTDFSNLKPVLSHDLLSFVKGVKSALFAYAGFEVLLIVFPFIKEPNKACKVSRNAIFLLILAYVIVIIESYAKFGVKLTQTFMYPTLSMIKASDVPGAFIERIEGVLEALWVLFVYTTIVSLLYSLSIVAKDIIGHIEAKHFVAIALPFLYLTSLIGDSIIDMMQYGDLITSTLGLYTIFILPIAMFIVSRFKKAGAKQ
ncbi:MAG: spore germination protein [Clostridiales bacterium]|nr:spore germination protein [Clostridiales bacterium]